MVDIWGYLEACKYFQPKYPSSWAVIFPTNIFQDLSYDNKPNLLLYRYRPHHPYREGSIHTFKVISINFQFFRCCHVTQMHFAKAKKVDASERPSKFFQFCFMYAQTSDILVESLIPYLPRDQLVLVAVVLSHQMHLRPLNHLNRCRIDK